jgi:hypothetical protein
MWLDVVWKFLDQIESICFESQTLDLWSTEELTMHSQHLIISIFFSLTFPSILISSSFKFSTELQIIDHYIYLKKKSVKTKIINETTQSKRMKPK